MKKFGMVIVLIVSLVATGTAQDCSDKKGEDFA